MRFGKDDEVWFPCVCVQLILAYSNWPVTTYSMGNCMFFSVSRVAILYIFLCMRISMCVVNGYLSTTLCLAMSAPWAMAPRKHL